MVLSLMKAKATIKKPSEVPAKQLKLKEIYLKITKPREKP